MKKSFVMLAAMLSCALVTLPSCGDDDPIEDIKPNPEKPVDPKPEEKPEQPAEAKEMLVEAKDHDKWVYVNLADGSTETKVIDPVAGTYKGNIALSVMGKPSGDIKDLKLEIVRVEKDSVNVTIKDFKFGSLEIPEIATGAKVEIDSINGSLGYKLACGEIKAGIEGVKIEAKSGHVISKDIEFTINVTPDGMPMPITAVYKGTIESTTNNPSINWDLAFHRMNVKTNGGSALMTEVTDINAVKEVPAGEFKADEESNEITVDMSGMPSGKIGYATDYINPVLGAWVSMKGMPPTFTVKENVFILKTAEGKHIKLQFSDYTNDKGKGGYVTFKFAEIK